MTRLVIFDLDGTLVDAYRAIQASLNRTRKVFGLPRVSLHRAKMAIGHGDRDFIVRFFDAGDIESALSIYRKDHEKSLLKGTGTLPGARKVLNILKRKKYKLAIASNRPYKFTDILLRHLKIRKYFDVVACAKDIKDAKPKPDLLNRIMESLKADKAHTVSIGDMDVDITAGRRAGVKTLAVLGGSSSHAELKGRKPDKIIKKIDEILPLLQAAKNLDIARL
jgi:phosphoglycolate phosphatase